MRRPLMVGALAAAVITLVATAAVAAGTLGGPSSLPSTTGGYGHGLYAGMMNGQGQGRWTGTADGSVMGSMGMVWVPGDGVAVSSIPTARARAASASGRVGLHPGEVMWFENGFYVELKAHFFIDKAGILRAIKTGGQSPEQMAAALTAISG